MTIQRVFKNVFLEEVQPQVMLPRTHERILHTSVLLSVTLYLLARLALSPLPLQPLISTLPLSIFMPPASLDFHKRMMTPCAVSLSVPGSSHLYFLKALFFGTEKTPAVSLRKSDQRSTSTNRQDVVLEFRTRHVKRVRVTKSTQYLRKIKQEMAKLGFTQTYLVITDIVTIIEYFQQQQ